ncbi:hypothetical protein NQZ68_019472, partial [Dissostichus eleginoides]
GAPPLCSGTGSDASPAEGEGGGGALAGEDGQVLSPVAERQAGCDAGVPHLQPATGPRGAGGPGGPAHPEGLPERAAGPQQPAGGAVSPGRAAAAELAEGGAPPLQRLPAVNHPGVERHVHTAPAELRQHK